MRPRTIVPACSVIFVAMTAGCAGGAQIRSRATFKWAEGQAPSVANGLPSSWALVRATARKITGPYRSYPMALAWPCAAEFEVAAGSIPNNESVTNLRIEFCQGDEIAVLLQRSNELVLIFDHDGHLLAAGQAPPGAP